MTPPTGADAPDVRKDVEAARARSAISFDELWLSFFGLGGDATSEQVRSYLTHGDALSRQNVNTLVQAVNEHFLDRGLGMPVPYQEG